MIIRQRSKYMDVLNLANLHNIDLAPRINEIKIDGFDESKFSKEDIFHRRSSLELEDSLSNFKKNKNKYGRSCVEYTSELMANLLMEDIVPIIFNKHYTNFKIKKNPKSGDANKLITTKPSAINSNADLVCQKKGGSPFLSEMMIDYTSLIERNDYLTFRGFEGIVKAKYKNKYEYLVKNKIPIFILSKKTVGGWSMCHIKTDELQTFKIKRSSRMNYGKGALEIYGFKKRLKDCDFLNNS